MKNLNNLFSIFNPTSQKSIDFALLWMRIGIGILTILHGIPKLMSGVSGWSQLGITFMVPLGISFLPTVWGFLAAVTEFFGGIALVLGFGTRFASLLLSIMMIIAAVWHIQNGDVFTVYSFPLSLLVIYSAFIFTSAGPYSIDHHFDLTYKKDHF